MTLESNMDKKFFKLSCENDSLSVKIKFLELDQEEEEP